MNSSRKTKRRNKLHKPRNPLMAPVLQRKAGAHRKSEAALRRARKVELQKADARADD